MSDTLAPFESPKELIDGAKEQLADLQSLCVAFGANCPYEIISYNDDKTGEKIVALRLNNPMPRKIRRLTSTILKETRLALDQAMCDGAVALGKANPRNVYFPVAKSEIEMPDVCRLRCKGVDQRLVDFATKFKPYYGGNTLLWALSANAGKTHQRIVGARPQDQGSFTRAIIQCVGPLQITINKWNATYDEMQVATLQTINSSITINPNFILSLEVIFSETADQIAGRPVIATLHQMIDIAEGIVLGLEAETDRLLGERTA